MASDIFQTMKLRTTERLGLPAMMAIAVLAMMIMMPVRAAPPATIHYQGSLANAAGTPINGNVAMTFRLYGAASGGAALFSETQPSVSVVSGLFNVQIGAQAPINLPFDAPYWLTIAVNADVEMSPRQPLAASAYAFRAVAADTLAPAASIAGAQISGSITNATIPAANVVGAVAGVPGPQGPAGPPGPVGPAGPSGADGGSSPTANITLLPSTAAGVGNVFKGTNSFIHNFGVQNVFTGELAGNFTMTGGANTGHGFAALAANSTGFGNTGNGWFALGANTTGASNTASGSVALANNTTGSNNTAVGDSALLFNIAGIDNTGIGAGSLRLTTVDANTAVGARSLAKQTNGGRNTAIGVEALFNNTTGYLNVALGQISLHKNIDGIENTAIGFGSMRANTSGKQNAALGVGSMAANVGGEGNTALGTDALASSQLGSYNIAVGWRAGQLINFGNYNITIGNDGTLFDEQTTRIGTTQTRAFIAGIRGVTTGSASGVPVLIDSAGQLGTASSSQRVKDDIADMGSASDVLAQLRPVTFTYKAHAKIADKPRQYGLIAEEVAAVAPDLVARSASGEIETVYYQHLAPMLLNELQKQRRTIQRQAELLSTMAGELDAIKAQLTK